MAFAPLFPCALAALAVRFRLRDSFYSIAMPGSIVNPFFALFMKKRRATKLVFPLRPRGVSLLRSTRFFTFFSVLFNGRAASCALTKTERMRYPIWVIFDRKEH